MEKITSVILDKGRITAVATNINVLVEGTSNAIYSVEITRSSDGRNYDFVTNVFESSVSGNSRLRNQSIGSFNIAIPAASGGDTYTIGIFAEPHFNTMLDLGTNNNIYQSFIVEQVADAVLTLSTDGSSVENATTLGTSTGSIANSFSGANRPSITMEDSQLTVAVAAADFGAFITTPLSDGDLNNGTWNDSALYWQTTEAIVTNPAGDGVSGNTVTVADLTGIVVGMELTYHKGTTAPGSATEISSIDTDTKTITFSTSVAFEEGETMTFKAYGPRLINNAIGAQLQLDLPTVKLEPITTSIDDEITSNITAGADINVNGTTGISKGATIRMRGLNKSSSSSTCTVSAVDNSANGGGITGGALQLANGRIEASSDRPIRTKTKLYIDGSSNKLFLSGILRISKYPSANQTIYVDTSKIFTAGTAS